MARPQKKGLDYFPLDVDIDQDDKIALIEAQHGLEGFAIVIKLLMKIYKNGYFYEWTEKEQLLFSKRVNVDINGVNGCINDCIKWGLFNEKLFETYKILTSKGVQCRYLEAVGRRQKVEMEEKYLLLDQETINAYKNIVIINTNINLNEVNEDINQKSKVNKSKVNKSEDKEEKTLYHDNLVFDLCKYYEQLKPCENITQHIDFLKISIELYGYDWTKEAIQICISKKGKFIKPWVETVLKNWKAEGKEEIDNGGDRTDSKPNNGSNKENKENKPGDYDFSKYGG